MANRAIFGVSCPPLRHLLLIMVYGWYYGSWLLVFVWKNAL